jgi:hypothetical protein
MDRYLQKVEATESLRGDFYTLLEAFLFGEVNHD